MIGKVILCYNDHTWKEIEDDIPDMTLPMVYNYYKKLYPEAKYIHVESNLYSHKIDHEMLGLQTVSSRSWSGGIV